MSSEHIAYLWVVSLVIFYCLGRYDWSKDHQTREGDDDGE